MTSIQKPLEPLPADRTTRRRSRRARRKASRQSRIEQLFFGTALAAFGAVAWGVRQEQDWAESLLGAWPLLLAWVGLGKLLSGRFTAGIGLLTGGALAFLHLEGLADFEYTWPLILVAVGVVVTLEALVGRGGPLGDDPDAESTDAARMDTRREETSHG